MSIEFPKDEQPIPGVPKFETYQEELEWRFEKISESIKNLAERSMQHETFLMRGADMIQYKPPGADRHLNLTQLFDDLYGRLNTLEEKLSQREHISD